MSYSLSAGSRVEADRFQVLLADADVETFLDLSFEGVELSPEEEEEADEALALFQSRKRAA